MQKRLLISRGTIEKITPSLVQKLKEACQTDECFAVIGYDNQVELYEDSAFCITRTDCLNINYDKYYSILNLHQTPIDAEDLTYFQSFITSAMLMQRRFEERTMLNYSKTLSKHFEKVVKHILFWFSILKQKRIDVVVFTDAPHEVYDYIIYKLCKRLNIQTFIYRYVYKTDRYFVMEDIDKASKDCLYQLNRLQKDPDINLDELSLDMSLESLYHSLISENDNAFSIDINRGREFAYRFGEDRVIPYIKDNIKRSKENSLGMRSIYRYIKNFFFIQKKKRDTKDLINNYERLSSNPCFSEKYIYLALHLLPESAAEPLGGVFSEQFWVAHLISCYLPEGWKLYIKMHPAQVSTVVTVDYIKMLQSIPNTRIVSLKSSQKELIKNAKAVATLTGEIALEAMFENIPCLIFGNTYYEALPTSLSVKKEEDMRNAVESIMNKQFVTSEKERRIYFKALELSSYKGVTETVEEICRRICVDKALEE